MSNVGSNALSSTSTAGRAAVSAGHGSLESMETKARAARAFLIHLVSREIQLSDNMAGWLRSTAQHLTERSMAERAMTDLATDCVRLAGETWQLREQLVALAHRLVARRNRGQTHRRLNVMSLLEQPASPAMLDFIGFNEALVGSGPPGAVLAVVSAVEQLLSGVIPLAIDIAGLADDEADDLAEVAQAYEARFARAEALRRLTAALAAADPENGRAVREAGDSAIAHYTEIIRESAELSREPSRGVGELGVLRT